MTSYKQRVHYHNLFNVLRDIKNCPNFSHKLVKLLYGIQKHDSIQIKYNGKTQFDFPYGETTRLENPV